MQIYALCPQCQKSSEFIFSPHALCSCGYRWSQHPTDLFLETGRLDQCPLCGCAHVYRQKDFNRAVGVGLVVVGVALAYFTYGISLLLVTLIDFFLYRFVKEVGICYQCQSQFRKGPTISQLQPFNLSLHDYYRNLRSGAKG